GEPGQNDDGDDDAEGAENDGKAPARLLETALGPKPEANGQDDADQQSEPYPREGLVRERPGHVDTALVDEDIVRELDGVAHRRHRLEDGEVPKKELQEQRDVADGLDVDGRKPRDEEVRRQPGDADCEAEQRGGDDPESSHENG